MRKALALSIRLYFQCYIQSLSPTGRRIVPLCRRRILILLFFFPAFFLLQGLNWLCLGLDEILFHGYRKVRIRNPLFVTGVPRSGTTFLHRTLARDNSQFTTFSTWEAILAPSIIQKKVIRALSRVDSWIGRPFGRLFNAISGKLSGSLADIHEVGLGSPEEDYLSLLPAGGCFLLALAFPANPSIWLLARFQDMPDEHREILVSFYKASLQRHLYTFGTERRFLSKNAAFASWVPDLRMTFPDARFIFCIREPKPTLSSQLSSVRSGIEFFGTLSAIDTFSLEFQTVLAHAYRVLRDEMKSFLPDHLAIIDLNYLKKDANNLLTTAVKRLCLDLTGPLEDAIRDAGQASRTFVSKHRHEPLKAKSGPTEFIACVEPIYGEMLSQSIRCQENQPNPE